MKVPRCPHCYWNRTDDALCRKCLSAALCNVARFRRLRMGTWERMLLGPWLAAADVLDRCMR